jgi:hypothetical protein
MRRALAGACRTRHEHEPALFVGEPSNALGQAERIDLGNFGRDHAQDRRQAAALAEQVHAEAADAVDRVGTIVLPDLVEVLARLRLPEQQLANAAAVGRAERLVLDGPEPAVDAVRRAVTDQEVQVRGAQTDAV